MINRFNVLPTVFRKASPSNHNISDLESLAQKTIQDLSDLYMKHTEADIITMADLLLKARTSAPKKRFSLICQDFFRKAHDMKGEGTTFNYPLLTFLGQVICDYLRNKENISINDLNLLQDCLTDIQNIFKNHITASGGEFGQKIHQKWGNIHA